MAELAVGQVIDGRYELEAVIGKGGMGCVYRARHVITHGRVALKVMTEMDAEAVQRFLAEARAASTIGHPAIVAVSDAGRTADGQPFLVMELLAGKPLRIAMHGGLPGDQIKRIGLELLDVLGAAHARGIVHRDLKPENIFVLAGTGAIKVLDFGIAKVLGAGTTTVSGFVLGTIEYMAPEQLLDAAAVDGRADLWAIGVILYELIAGVRPFGGATREARYTALATEEPMPIEEVVPVSAEVSQFFRLALAREPARRFQTAAQMADALRRLSMVPHTASHVAQTGVGATLGTGAVAWGGGSVGATLGTGAPRPPASILPPTAPSPDAPPPAPVTARKLPILLAVGLVIVAGAIGFGMMMGARTSSSSTVASGSTTESKAPPDAAVVVDDQPVQRDCTSHCERLAACKLASSSCRADCTDLANRACLDHAKDCGELAACFWNRKCGRPIKTGGGMRCFDVFMCYSKVATVDTSIQCGSCFDLMSDSARLAYARVEVCTASLQADSFEARRTGKPFDAQQEFLTRCQPLRDACSADRNPL